jgi:hypothetical protein
MTDHERKIEVKTIPVPGENWIVKSVDTRVFADGEVCPYVILNCQLGKRYVGLETIKNDLDTCMHLLIALENKVSDDPLVLNALLESFITKYGRCYADAKEGRGTKLEEDIFDDAPDMIRKAHENLINERNNFTAHAGSSESDKVSGRLALNPPHKGQDLVTFYIARDFTFNLGADLLCEYGALIRFVKGKIDLKLDKVYEKLKEDYAKHDIKELYDRSKYVIA